jgi:hypothetical protein
LSDGSVDVLLKSGSKNPFDDVKEIIEMPSYHMSSESNCAIDAIELDSKVAEQLRDFLVKVSSMYHDNPFHSCECRL